MNDISRKNTGAFGHKTDYCKICWIRNIRKNLNFHRKLKEPVCSMCGTKMQDNGDEYRCEHCGRYQKKKQISLLEIIYLIIGIIITIVILCTLIAMVMKGLTPKDISDFEYIPPIALMQMRK